MSEHDVTQARERLVDAISLYRLQPRGMTSLLVEAATDSLVAGSDSPALRDLAGRAPSESLWALDALVEDVTEELDLADHFAGKQLEVLAAGAMCRRAMRGELDTRDLSRWARQAIGHGGPTELRPLVDLDCHDDLVDLGVMSVADATELAHQTIARLAMTS